MNGSTDSISYNTIVGATAGESINSSYNTAIGYEALQGNTNGYNTAIGYHAGSDNPSGTYACTVIGTNVSVGMSDSYSGDYILVLGGTSNTSTSTRTVVIPGLMNDNTAASGEKYYQVYVSDAGRLMRGPEEVTI